MRFDKTTVALFLITTLLTVYTITLHVIADGHIYEDPVSHLVYWTGGPSGSLFPWPRTPGMLEIITQLNEVDYLIYQHLIKTWALAGLSIIMWVITGLFVFQRIKPTERIGAIESTKGITRINQHKTN